MEGLSKNKMVLLELTQTLMKLKCNVSITKAPMVEYETAELAQPAETRVQPARVSCTSGCPSPAIIKYK